MRARFPTPSFPADLSGQRRFSEHVQHCPENGAFYRAATGMVDKLQEMGYLKRMSAAKDRRKIMVAITQEGRDLVARMRQNIVRDLAALMAGADPDARQTLADTGKSIRKRRLA